MKKNIYIFEQKIIIQGNVQKQIALSFSKYTDCLIIIINQTGAVGSILQGDVLQSMAQLQAQEYFEQENISQPTTNYLYQIKNLFGSAQIQFYELLLRRMMGIIWQQRKCQQKFKIILNISLPLFDKQFNQQQYYKSIIANFQKEIHNVI